MCTKNTDGTHSILFKANILTMSGSGGLVAKLCYHSYDPRHCSPPGSSVHGILQARILEWVDIFFSRESSWPRKWTSVSCTAGRFFNWATREALTMSGWYETFNLPGKPSIWFCNTFSIMTKGRTQWKNLCTQKIWMRLLRQIKWANYWYINIRPP